jgi:hypothetical protein
MKQLQFIILMLFISAFSFAQNGVGYSSENEVLKATYGGYQINYHLFIIENKLNCSMDIRIDNDGVFTTRTINANDTIQEKVFMPLMGIARIRVKKIKGGECTPQPDNSWIEVQTLLPALPFRFIDFNIQQLFNGNVGVNFTSEEDPNVKFYRIMTSNDGINFKETGTIPASGTNITKKYNFNFNYNKN